MKMLLPKSLPLLSIISKKKPLLGLMLKPHNCCQLLGYYGPSTALFSRNINCIDSRCKLFRRMNRFSTLAAAIPHSPSKSSNVKMSKKERRALPENVLKQKLCVCSEKGNLVEALQLYDEARSNGIPLCKDHYSMLLYLCSSAASGSLVESQINGDDTNLKNLGMKRGLEIVQQMEIDKVEPNEATFTNTARLAAAMEDPEMAFDFVKKMKNSGITPRLRSYGPALFGFCKNGEAARAYDVDSHMVEYGVVAEEPELSALLKVSVVSKKHDKVYEMLHRIRSSVRQVSEPTAEVVKDWFNSEGASNVGKEKWDLASIKKGVIKGGGGWHGQGWLGTGKWSVVRGHMDMEGVCKTCGEKLVCIDIDPMETENFASSLTRLASQREAKTNFLHFQEWLQKHGPFDAVIDGANIGLIKQKDFNFVQLNSAVNQLRKLSPSKRLPLIVLHQSRVRGGPAKDPRNKKLLQQWKECGVLYETPVGSNDDWYWLYAAVSCNCLLVTNDEMRDHLFQLLGTSFFPRWKEKHQVRLSVSRSGINFHMPPSYSIVIQESENGSWHVPTVTGDDMETPREWLCITRQLNSVSQSVF